MIPSFFFISLPSIIIILYMINTTQPNPPNHPKPNPPPSLPPFVFLFISSLCCVQTKLCWMEFLKWYFCCQSWKTGKNTTFCIITRSRINRLCFFQKMADATPSIGRFLTNLISNRFGTGEIKLQSFEIPSVTNERVNINDFIYIDTVQLLKYQHFYRVSKLL